MQKVSTMPSVRSLFPTVLELALTLIQLTTDNIIKNDRLINALDFDRDGYLIIAGGKCDLFSLDYNVLICSFSR